MEKELLKVSKQVFKILENLRKDGSRPKTQKLIKSKLSELQKLENQYFQIASILQSKQDLIDPGELLKYNHKLKRALEESRDKLLNTKIIKMSETFDLKTAASIIQEFTGDPKTVDDFLDSVELYNSLLNAAGKTTLINFVIKTKIKGIAKTKINSLTTPTTFETLKTAITDRFSPKLTVASLNNQLHKVKQNKSSVTDFASEIEKLSEQLTKLQVTNDSEKSVISKVNEQYALDAFKKGLNYSIQSVILAANPSSLSEAITIALEAEANLNKENDDKYFNVRYVRTRRQIRPNFNQNISRNCPRDGIPRTHFRQCNPSNTNASRPNNPTRRPSQNRNSYNPNSNYQNNRNFYNSNSNYNRRNNINYNRSRLYTCTTSNQYQENGHGPQRRNPAAAALRVEQDQFHP